MPSPNLYCPYIGVCYSHANRNYCISQRTHTFTWFALEIQVCNPETRRIKKIGVDTEDGCEKQQVLTDLFNKISTNENGVYFNSRSNEKQYFIKTNKGKATNIKIAHQIPDGRLYYNVYVKKENLFTLEHYYKQNKSNPFLKRLTVKMKCHTDSLYCPFIGVCYWLHNRTCDKVEIPLHGNSKKVDANPYISTSQKTMDQERALLAEGHPVQYIYDRLLDESGGPLKSKSQSSEPHDKRQIYS